MAEFIDIVAHINPATMNVFIEFLDEKGVRVKAGMEVVDSDGCTNVRLQHDEIGKL